MLWTMFSHIRKPFHLGLSLNVYSPYLVKQMTNVWCNVQQPLSMNGVSAASARWFRLPACNVYWCTRQWAVYAPKLAPKRGLKMHIMGPHGVRQGTFLGKGALFISQKCLMTTVRNSQTKILNAINFGALPNQGGRYYRRRFIRTFVR